MRAIIPLLILALPAAAAAAGKPVVTLQSTAAVAGDTFELKDIAAIQDAGADNARIGDAQMGRSPLAGVTRIITCGDVALKLRQAGIDPATIVIQGANIVTISLQAPPATPVAAQGQGSATTAASMAAPGVSPAGAAPVASNNAAAIAPAGTAAFKAGDAVTAVYEDGPVRITLPGTLIGSASVGDRVSLTTAISGHALKGTLLDAGVVELDDPAH